VVVVVGVVVFFLLFFRGLLIIWSVDLSGLVHGNLIPKILKPPLEVDIVDLVVDLDVIIINFGFWIILKKKTDPGSGQKKIDFF
jgi:hypothetical protein